MLNLTVLPAYQISRPPLCHEAKFNRGGSGQLRQVTDTLDVVHIAQKSMSFSSFRHDSYDAKRKRGQALYPCNCSKLFWQQCFAVRRLSCTCLAVTHTVLVQISSLRSISQCVGKAILFFVAAAVPRFPSDYFNFFVCACDAIPHGCNWQWQLHASSYMRRLCESAAVFCPAGQCHCFAHTASRKQLFRLCSYLENLLSRIVSKLPSYNPSS